MYQINKATDKSVEFKGLKGQYLIYFAVGVVGCLFLVFIFNICGVPSMVTIPLVIILISIITFYVFRYNKMYGQYGLMQKQSRSNTPKFLLSRRTIKQILDKH